MLEESVRRLTIFVIFLKVINIQQNLAPNSLAAISEVNRQKRMEERWSKSYSSMEL
jgi:hypothetical protein